MVLIKSKYSFSFTSEQLQRGIWTRLCFWKKILHLLLKPISVHCGSSCQSIQVDNPNYKSRTEPAGNLIIKLLFEFTFIALSSTFHSPLKRTSKVDNEPAIYRVIKTNGSTFEKWIKTIWQNCSRKAAFFPRISSHQKLHFPKIARNSSKTFCMLSATRWESFVCEMSF